MICAVEVITAPACSTRRSAASSPSLVNDADADQLAHQQQRLDQPIG